MPRPTRLLAGLTLVLASVIPASAPALAATPPPDPVSAALPATPPPDPVSAAMERDLGLTSGQVRDLWAAETRARATADTLSRSLNRAAMWFDGASLVVGVTDDAQTALVGAAGARPQRVVHGAAELTRIAAAITAAPGVTSWGVDAASDSVAVTVTPGATQDVRDRLSALSGAVRLVESGVVPRQQGGEVVGGESWKPGTESNCSIGFSATGAGGTRHFLTAGHCTNDVNQAAYGKDGTRIGTSNAGGNRSVNAREGDFGLVDVTEAAWSLTGRVSGYGGGDLTVTGSAEPTTGMSICRSGGNTRLQCGTVTQVNQTIDYGNVVIEGLFVTNACSGGGDSGGSYVTGPKADAKAVGLHSGGGNGCGQSGPTTIGQPLNEALAKWGLALTTGAPQPGTPVVSNPGNQSGVVGTPLTLTNSASGGTAPYTWAATGLPAGLAVNATTGTVTGTPTAAGTSTVTLTASDSAGKSGSASFTWTVTTGGGGAISLANPGYQNAYVGRALTLPMRATGGSGALTWSATGLPPGLSINRTSGVISGTPTTWGLRTSTVSVTDATGASASARFGWSIWS